MASTPQIDTDRLAKLANLALSDNQLTEYRVVETYQSLASVSELDVESVSETARTSAEENVVREDVVRPSLAQAEALQNAPQTHEGYFVVKSVFENRDA